MHKAWNVRDQTEKEHHGRNKKKKRKVHNNGKTS
nr:MAG TPA: hypothetical protein [Microviridae sp.]